MSKNLPFTFFLKRRGRRKIFVSTERENLWGRRKDLDWSCFSFQSEGNLWKSRMGETLNWRFSQYNNSIKKRSLSRQTRLVLVDRKRQTPSWQPMPSAMVVYLSCVPYIHTDSMSYTLHKNICHCHHHHRLVKPNLHSRQKNGHKIKPKLKLSEWLATIQVCNVCTNSGVIEY